MSDEILILSGNEVAALLSGREAEVIATVKRAYVSHGRGQSSLPHSIFLRFPDAERNRIIALPAFLGDGFEVAGLKWVSSFPDNVRSGIERASAVLILNSCATGRPSAILEGSIISARRTAAGAALAAEALAARPLEEAGLIGTGVINFEVARFLRVVAPELRLLRIFDLEPARAADFGARIAERLPGLSVVAAASFEEVLAKSRLVSLATTAIRPHVGDLSICPDGSVLLHVSLRDLTPEAILASDNVVDDVDHVLRAATSVHLAEQQTGRRDFIRCTLPQILDGTAPPKARGSAVTVFSPFGLGVLDIAVGQLVVRLAAEQGVGTALPSFFPTQAD